MSGFTKKQIRDTFKLKVNSFYCKTIKELDTNKNKKSIENENLVDKNVVTGNYKAPNQN